MFMAVVIQVPSFGPSSPCYIASLMPVQELKAVLSKQLSEIMG